MAFTKSNDALPIGNCQCKFDHFYFIYDQTKFNFRPLRQWYTRSKWFLYYSMHIRESFGFIDFEWRKMEPHLKTFFDARNT